MTTTPEGESVTIKGSWENQLQEAQRLGGDFNDTALPIYEKLYTRLSKMPLTQRKAAGERLQNIFLQSAVDYQGFLTLRGRYDEALAIIDRLLEEVTADEAAMWENQAANVLTIAGRYDEALERVRRSAELASLDPLESLGDVMMFHLRVGEYAEAAARLAEMEELVADADVSEAARARDQALVANLAGTLALEMGEFERAADLIEASIRLNPDFKQTLHRTYTRLIRLGDPERAIPFMRRDQRAPIRAGFWSGVASLYLGEEEEAERQWRKIVEADLSDSEEPNLLEYVLAHYYLGDPDGAGLGLTLNVLQEDSAGQWALFLLAGIGWALRGNVDNARTNFLTAMNQRRVYASGLFLPWESWTFLEDLLEDDELAHYGEFFETERTPPGPAATPQAEEVAADQSGGEVVDDGLEGELEDELEDEGGEADREVGS